MILSILVFHCLSVRQYRDSNDGDRGRVSTAKNQEIHRRTLHLCNPVPARSQHVYSGRPT